MMAELINRKQVKQEVRELLRSAWVSPKGMVALYMGITLGMELLLSLIGATGFVYTFIDILTTLIGSVLAVGFTLYCMAIRRGERAGYLTLFDGFTFVGKIVLLMIVETFFILAWSMLLFIPGVIASYRYSFAVFNLCENPDIGVMEAIEMSKRQTMGYKGQLFMLDLSYMGWTLLAILPSMVYLGMSVNYLLQALDVSAVYSMEAAVGPAWLWLILVSVWGMLVSLFYLPNAHCVQLAYFETAKRTSGIGEGAGEDPTPRLEDGWNGL